MSMRRRTTREKYTGQRDRAAVRGIEFLLSYEEWLEMWLVSGKWEQRGKLKGQYQMTRCNDVGPYSVNNCSIETVAENQQTRINRYAHIGCEAEIIDMCAGGASQRAVAARFKISQKTVSNIVLGKQRNRSRG